MDNFTPLVVFVQLALKPGFHQQHLRVYNSIASAFLVVGGGSAACHLHEHQQRRSVGFGLSPLVVFVQLALKPGFHQQHLRVCAVVGVRAVGLEAGLSPTTLAGCTILLPALFWLLVAASLPAIFTNTNNGGQWASGSRHCWCSCSWV